MSKKLLEEATIRKFMKLAGTQPLADGFVERVDEASGKAGDMSRKDVANVVPAGSRWLKEEEEVELDEDLEDLTEQEEDLTEQEEDLGGMEDLGAEEAPEEEVGEEEAGEEEAMEAEAEVEGEEGEVTLEPEEAEVLKGVLEKLISAMGEEGDEEGLGMGEEELGFEEELPAEEELGAEEELPAEEEEPEEMMEALVKRISARVAKRLLETKK